MSGAPYGQDQDTEHQFRLHHVQLAAPPDSEDDCRRFWVEQLGFLEVQKPEALAARGGLWVRADGLEIHIGIEADFRPAKKAHPGILVKDIDGLALRFAAAGTVVEWDDGFPGFRRFYVADNVGNRIEFLERTQDSREATEFHLDGTAAP